MFDVSKDSFLDIKLSNDTMTSINKTLKVKAKTQGIKIAMIVQYIYSAYTSFVAGVIKTIYFKFIS